MSVIFAKITPKHIEATSFALLAGVSNFRASVRGWLGAYINDAFVGVTQDDLSGYWKLVTISFFCSFIPLMFLNLIPTKASVDKLQSEQHQQDQSGQGKSDSNHHAKVSDLLQ